MKSWSLLGEPPRTLKETMMEAEYNHLNHATWESSFSRRSTARSCCSGRSSGTWAKYFTIWHDGRSAGSRRATCSHADTDTPEVFGGADHRAHERKSSIWIAQKCRRQDEKFPGPQIPGSRIFCPTVGRDEEMIRAYIRKSGVG